MKMKYLLMTLVVIPAVVGSGVSVYADTTSTGTTSSSTAFTESTHSGVLQKDKGMRSGSGFIHPVLKTEREEDRGVIKGLRDDAKTTLSATCSGTKAENALNRTQIRTNWNVFHVQMGSLKTYLRTDLTSEEKATVTTLAKAHIDSRNAIVTGSGTDAEKWAALTASLDTFLTGVRAYVATDKLEAFDAFKAARIKLLQDNATLRFKNEDNRATCKLARETSKETVKTQVSEVKNTFSSGAIAQFTAKLDSVPTADRSVVYTKIAEKLTLLTSNAKNNRTKTLYTEMLRIVQARLDAMTSTVTP